MQPTMSKNFCFTANSRNHNLLEYLPLADIQLHFAAVGLISYVIIGQEKGDKEETSHWQGFVQTTKQCRHSALRKLLPDPKKKKSRWNWHWEAKHRNATADQARDYCKKEGNWHEWGVFKPTAAGRRTDIHEFAEAIKSGLKTPALIEQFGSMMIRYWGNAIKMIAALEAESAPLKRAVQTFVFYGPTGCGKTHRAIFGYEDQPFLIHAADLATQWWDGYNGQRRLVIDDWTAGSCKITDLMKYLDIYKCRLAIKGSFTWARWEHIIITTNKNWLHPSDPQSDMYPGADQRHREALWRRITNVYHLEKDWREQTPPLCEEDPPEKTPPPVKQMAGKPPLVRQHAFVFDPVEE